jgi:hypothetical protein
MNGMQRRERRMSFALGDSVPLVTIPECVQEGSSQDRACQQQSSSSAQTSSVFGTYGHTNRAQGPGDSSCSVADVSCSSKRAAHSFCAGQHMMSQVWGDDTCSSFTDTGGLGGGLDLESGEG